LTHEEIIGHLATHYGGDVPARTLWLQAGGSDDEIAYDGSATQRWTAMWNAALTDADDRHMALVREMLLDNPGDAALSAWVVERSREAPEFFRGPIASLVDVLDAADPGLEADEGRAWLQSLPVVSAPLTFMVLAEALEKRLSDEQRAGVEEWLDVVGQDAAGAAVPTLSGIGKLLRREIDLALPPGEWEEDEALRPAGELLGKQRSDFELWSRDEPPLTPSRAREARERLEAITEELEPVLPDSGPVAVLLMLMESHLAPLAAVEDEEPGEEVETRARALRLALWATSPREDPSATSATSAEPEAEA
jgi:hypothetical protein